MGFYDLVNSTTIQGNVEIISVDDDGHEETVFSVNNVEDLAYVAVRDLPENFNEYATVNYLYASDGKLIIEVNDALLED